VASLCVVLCLNSLSSETYGDENLSGFDLFVEALANQGRNSLVIHSGVVTAKVSTKRKGFSETEVLYFKQLEKESLEDALSRLPSDSDRYVEYKNALANLDKIVSEKYTETIEKTRIFRITFRGNNPFSDAKEEIYDGPVFEITSLPDRVMVAGFNTMEGKYVSLMANNDATYTEITYDFSPESITCLGRARGMRVDLWSALLLKPDQVNSGGFIINTEAIEELRNFNNDLYETLKKQIQIIEERNFENGNVFVVSIPNRKNETLRQIGFGKTIIWIDPAKGYVCPLIEEYYGDEGNEVLLYRYEASDYFLDENSGLWFPSRAKTTQFDTIDPQKIDSETVYEILVSQTKLNIPISDEEFSFAIKKGGDVD